MNGYMGKLLFVDLSTGEHTVEPLEPETAKNFMGGQGLGAKILYDRMPAHADVFGPDSMLGFVSGPLNNTGAFFGGRYTVVSKSPVTNGWNDANSGGFFGTRLRKSGYDGIFVRGISEKPVYLFIHDGEVEICDAAPLWGMKVTDVEDKLQAQYGKSVGIAVIGPAGENLSNMAAIMNDGHRAAARGGSGAVMGSKKLKAVVVTGSGVTPVAQPDKIKKNNLQMVAKSAKKLLDRKRGDLREFYFYGTGGTYEASVASGDAGVRNWTGTNALYSPKNAHNQSSQGLKKYNKGRYYCASCPVGCSRFMKVESQKWGTFNTTRPDYETMGAFGSLMLNVDAESVCMANELCNQYGFDTISAGSTIAWAMDCYNHEILTLQDLDGIDLSWGNSDAMIAILKLMCQNQGVGKILAKGSQKAAELLGKGEEYLAVANGIEQPEHDARLYYGLGRTYLADPTPGRHVKGGLSNTTAEPGFDPKTMMGSAERGGEDMEAVANAELTNASGACAFGYDNAELPTEIQKNILYVTGQDYTNRDARNKLGRRLFTIRQAFNLREGLDRTTFKISKRMMTPSLHAALANPAQETTTLNFDIMIDNLYEALDWSREGVPSRKALLALGGLENVIQTLYGAPPKQEEGSGQG